MPWIKCFLCRRKDSHVQGHKLISQTLCKASNKTLLHVLQYLSRLTSIVIHIPKDELLCFKCFHYLDEYDEIMMKLIRRQRKLMKMLEHVVDSVDSDYEKECNAQLEALQELEEDNFFDEEETVSDQEIEKTMHEAISGKTHDNLKTKLNTVNKRLTKELHSCNYCAMRFKNKLNLHRHISAAHRKHACNLCSYSHRNEEYVKLHMNLHEGRDQNQCRYCDKVFSTKISTIRHMEVHLDLKKYQCDKCGLVFSQTTVLYNHKLQHEAEEQPLKCEICHQMFKTKRTFRHHMITHRPDRPRFTCEYCQKTFTEKYTLKVHKRTHPESGETAILSNQTAISESLEQQIESAVIVAPIEVSVCLPPASTVLNPESNRFNCIICDQEFFTKEQLNKHMEKDHDVIVNALSVSNYSQYEVVNEPKRPCHICGYIFSSQSNLDIHLEHVHAVAFK